MDKQVTYTTTKTTKGTAQCYGLDSVALHLTLECYEADVFIDLFSLTVWMVYVVGKFICAKIYIFYIYLFFFISKKKTES